MHQIDRGIKENFFRWTGRLNRKRYFNRCLVIFLAGIVIYTLMAILVFLAGGDPNQPDTDAARGIVGLFTLLRIPLTVSSFMLMIRRLHDIGLSGYFCFLIFIPFVNFGLVLYLFFKRGTAGDNAYGPDPLGAAAERVSETPYARGIYADHPTDIAPPKEPKD